MNKVLSKKLIPLAALLLSIVLAIASICSLSFANSHADTSPKNTNYVPFPTTELKIENNQFGSSSGSVPKTPDSWTGAGVDSAGAGATIGGVIDLDTYANDKQAIKLADDYADDFSGNNRPDSPFGNSQYPETNRNVLMINVRPRSNTAYGYSSAAITFAPSRFYMISTWVRTGNFAPSTGAAIRLTGLDESVAFNNINTVKTFTDSNGNFDPSKLDDTNNYGWAKYTFYIASNAMAAKTVNLSLQVGDKFTSADKPENNIYYPASGYAFFDNINAYEISPADFYAQKATSKISDKVLVKDFSDINDYVPQSSTGYDAKNLNFTKGLNDWSTVVGKNSDLSDLEFGIYDAYPEFDFKADSRFNLKKDPVSSLGKFEDDSNILVLSSYAGADEYASIAAGVRSKSITIERYKFYRISAWVNSIDVSGGSGATMILHSKRGASEEKYLNSKISNCVGDDTNKARGGYKQYSFYVKGSSLADYDVNLDLWLGSTNNESKGIALFDNVSVESITPKQFSDNGGNGTIVNLDTDAGSDGAPFRTFPNTGIANGEFYFAGDYTNYKFPLPAADWTKYDVSTVGTTGFSTQTDFVDNTKIISGIMPCDDEHFAANRANYGENIYNPREISSTQLKGSMLLMASSKPTAFCYRSPSFTVTAKAAATDENAQAPADPQIGKLTVNMFVDNITGYGANLVLKSGTTVISTIEKIQDTTQTKSGEYTFYIQPGKTDITDLSVEIWLGLNDKKDNSTKTSSGNIYVEKVQFAMVADKDGSIFANAKNIYDNTNQGNQQKTAVYSYASEDLSAYDHYDTNFVKSVYNYTATITGDPSNVTYGVFNPKNGLDRQTIVPSYFKNTLDAKNKNVLILKNSSEAASKLTLNTKYTLEIDKFYKLSVRLKVDIGKQVSSSAVGAGIYLSGSKFQFSNILSTSETHDQFVDNEVFQTYNFYIKSGATASTVGLDITLGDASSTSKYCSGIVYVNDITFTDITNSLFDENTTDEKLKDNSYAIKAVLSDSAETPETPPTEKTPIHWMVIPSILFAIAILIAIVGFSVRKILERRKERRPSDSSKVASYDREHTLNKDYNNNNTLGSSNTTPQPSNETYDNFNDDVTPIAQPIAPEPVQTEVEPLAETQNTVIADEPKQQDEPKPDTFTDQFDD